MADTDRDSMLRICNACRLTKKSYNYTQTGEEFTGSENMLICELIGERLKLAEALLKYAGSRAFYIDDYIGELKRDQFIAGHDTALDNLDVVRDVYKRMRISAINNICNMVKDARANELRTHLDVVNKHVRSACNMFGTMAANHETDKSDIRELRDLYYDISHTLYGVGAMLCHENP